MGMDMIVIFENGYGCGYISTCLIIIPSATFNTSDLTPYAKDDFEDLRVTFSKARF